MSYAEYMSVPAPVYSAPITWAEFSARIAAMPFYGTPVTRLAAATLYGQLTGTYNFSFFATDITALVQNSTPAPVAEVVEPTSSAGWSNTTIVLVILALVVVVALIWGATQYLA
jgi:hypothetical protein